MTSIPLDGMVEQTGNYRAARLALWKTLQKKRDEYVSAARQHGASDDAAHEAAARHVRGDVRVFVDELLLHLREHRAGAFVQAAPREWGVRTELLLDVDPLVPSFIGESFPVAAWTVALDAAERESVALLRAEREEEWGAWLKKRLERLDRLHEKTVDHIFGVTAQVGQGVGEGLGDLGKGAGNALTGAGDALKILAGVLGTGAVVLAGLVVLRRRS